MAHVYREVHTVHPVARNEPDYFEDAPLESGASTGEQIVYFLGGVAMVLLSMRFLLMILGANTGNTFSRLIYNVTQPLVAPFYSLFNYHPAYGSSRFEFETLIAIFVYGLVAIGIAELIALFDRRRYVH